MIHAPMHRIGLTLSLAIVLMSAAGCDDQLKAEKARLTTENAELRSELETARAALSAAEADRNTQQAKLAQLQAEGGAASGTATGNSGDFSGVGEGVTAEAGAGGIIVRVPGDVLFDAGKATLKDSAKQTLSRIAQVLNSKYAGRTIRVEGYTDTDPVRASAKLWKDNLELSGQRAMAVQRYLASQGLSASQMYSAAKGDTNPRATKQASRRVEIVVLNE